MSACVKWVWPLPDLSFTVLSWSSLLQHNQAPFILSIALSDWATVHLLCSGLSFARQCVLFLRVALQDTRDRCCHLVQASWGKKKCQFRSEAGFHLHTGPFITRLQTCWLETTPGISHRSKATRRSGGTETGRKNGFCLAQCFHINRRSMVLCVLCDTTSPLKKKRNNRAACTRWQMFSNVPFQWNIL